MDTGMLWFDDSDRPLATKIERAVTYYRDKYEKAPNLCVVHPSMMPDTKSEIKLVELKEATAVMPHHYWIGIHEAESSNGAGKREKRKAA